MIAGTSRAKVPLALGVALSIAAEAASSPAGVAEAERLAFQARARAATSPEEALGLARRALAMTGVFDPTAFAQAGRRGEIVEDVFVAAREAYRRHRSRLYAAVGDALLHASRPAEATRYLRRAYDLDPAGGRPDFARGLLRSGRLDEARGVLLASPGRDLADEDRAALQAIADAAGLPSAQAEIDRSRIEGLGKAARFRYGPLPVPANARLSSGGLLRLDAAPLSLLYLADASCRTCSRDLEAVKHLASRGAQVVIVPASRDDDTVLRRTLALYRYDWPILIGSSLHSALQAEAPALILVARDTFSVVVVPSPLEPALSQAVAILSRADLEETRPRAQWNRRAPSQPRVVAAPSLLPNGLAPGEEGAPQDDVAAAAAAFDTGRPAEALTIFERLAGKGDGTLLPPEAAYNRALCLAAMGRNEEARRILLGIGDSRFQEAVDRALERVGSTPHRTGAGDW